MKSIGALCAAGLVLGAAATAARAADPVDACSSAWKGFYLGGHGGYVLGEVETDIGDKNLDGWIAGGLAGYNWQHCSFVWGFEGDAGFGNIDSKKGVNFNDFDLEPNGHARVHMGYAMNDTFMPFIAGGLAVMDGDLREPLFPGAISDSKVHWGFSVGGGVNWAFHDNWAWRLEYLYDNYGEKTYDLAVPTSVDVDTHTLRSGITYKFNY